MADILASDDFQARPIRKRWADTSQIEESGAAAMETLEPWILSALLEGGMITLKCGAAMGQSARAGNFSMHRGWMIDETCQLRR